MKLLELTEWCVNRMACSRADISDATLAMDGLMIDGIPDVMRCQGMYLSLALQQEVKLQQMMEIGLTPQLR